MSTFPSAFVACVATLLPPVAFEKMTRRMADLDLGRLLRLKSMAESAAPSVEPDGYSAPALTGSYARLRAEIARMLEGSGLEQEFANAFPEITVIKHARNTPRVATRDASAAREVRILLGQLGGWLEGLIAERTLEQRLRYEAEERMRQ